MAFLIALEGIDGSGKGTQAQRLVERLTADGRSTRLISFPRYGQTLFGRAVGQFLNGRFGPLDAVHPVLASLLYAGDRFESRGLLREASAAADVLVIDRYVASNVAHQGAKLEGAERREFIDWIAAVEYDVYELPRPHLTLLLDLPAPQAQQLIARKRPRDYTDRDADIQEADAGYLSRVRQLYLEMSQGGADWHRIECFRDEGLRTIDDVADEIWNVVNRRIESRI